MKNPNSKRKLQAMLKLAVFGSMIFMFIALVLNLCVQRHSGNGENDWGLSFVMTQAAPLYWLLQLLYLIGIEFGNFSGGTYVLLATIADGFAMFLFLLILGTIWQFVLKGEPENKNQTTGI